MMQNYSPDGNHRGGHKSGFWTSIPGILTGVAAVIGSIGGLVGALFAAGVIGGSDSQPQPAINAGASPVAAAQATPTTAPFEAAPQATPRVDLNVSSPGALDISGFWISQGGLSWEIAQTGEVVEILSLDVVGTGYFGVRSGEFINITQVSNLFGLFPSSGSMEIQDGGDVISVVIEGEPDILRR